ncbi:transposase, partial [Haemophilus aegyptius ATCC 11116]
MLKLKDFYSVQELFEFHSQYLPSSIRRIKDKAERENWESRKRVG